MDAASLLRTVGSLGAVLGLLCLALWATRRYNIRLPGVAPAHGQRRLAVVERVALDARRSVALIRRDGREHLLLLSPEGHQIVEAAIEAPAAAFETTSDFAALVDASNATQDRPSIKRDSAAMLTIVVARLAPVLATVRMRAHQAQRWVAARLPHDRSVSTAPRPTPARPARTKPARPAKHRARATKGKARARG